MIAVVHCASTASNLKVLSCRKCTSWGSSWRILHPIFIFAFMCDYLRFCLLLCHAFRVSIVLFLLPVKHSRKSEALKTYTHPKIRPLPIFSKESQKNGPSKTRPPLRTYSGKNTEMRSSLKTVQLCQKGWTLGGGWIISIFRFLKLEILRQFLAMNQKYSSLPKILLFGPILTHGIFFAADLQQIDYPAKFKQLLTPKELNPPSDFQWRTQKAHVRSYFWEELGSLSTAWVGLDHCIQSTQESGTCHSRPTLSPTQTLRLLTSPLLGKILHLT